ncbi:MAG TPA: DUF4185 domain-containing protein [Propionibacterium sp.]|jgi:hypothetical protein|nr:DUF4185 domain-containing protein [Propionibacterium sp.]
MSPSQQNRVRIDSPVRVVETVRHSQITGPDSINRTAERFGVTATDLGLLWDAGPDADGNDRVFVMFGDTYGDGWGGRGAGPQSADWRTNVLFASTNKNLEADSVRLDSAVSRVRRGGAAQVIRRNRLNVPRARFPEHTLIPNAGITVDGVHYVQWMSVTFWRGGGKWRTFQSGIAVSRDDARTWTKPVRGRWWNIGGGSRFQVAAFTRDDDWVYLFGTTNGRYGPAYVARVRPDHVARRSAYRYWDGTDWRRRERDAVPVIDGPIGEMSVIHHRGLDRWLALHLDEDRAAIVLHSAREITGPWSSGVEVASGSDYPALYGGFIHPWAVDEDRIYWLMSQWDPYNVYLMRTTLALDEKDQ